ncbi:TIR domain-containing protein [Psidium guajava]|nr:TIR domain-containing protein [Psidium guajava]
MIIGTIFFFFFLSLVVVVVVSGGLGERLNTTLRIARRFSRWRFKTSGASSNVVSCMSVKMAVSSTLLGAKFSCDG